MELRTVRRGLAALAIASTLGLAGAHPAAAEEPGWFEQGLRWLADLWSADKAAPGGGEPSAIWMLDTVDRGYGMDPNGGVAQGGTPPPGQGQ
jgi:hypothetical protein